MHIWQRNHAGGNIYTRVIQVTDTLFHAEAVESSECLVTFDDRMRATLDLAQARADEMVRRQLNHECQPHLCDAWHPLGEVVQHGAPYPIGKRGRAPSDPSSILIVQRGRTAWVDFLRRRLDSLSADIAFSWDRRFEQRRRRRDAVDLDRRGSDRRGSPPVAWQTLHFVLTTLDSPPQTG
jgi:hypothetical protein